MNKPLSPIARMLSLICGIILIVVIFVPMWRIDLTAPQYPEGLVLKIHANKLSGDVDVINGLNHYIGMRKLVESDFIEFTILPYLIGFFALMGIITYFVNRRWMLYTFGTLYILFGIIAMYDFYRWEYDYGHNLDPTAAIIVPGMAYQPPLIGFKQLLNFGAYSFPDVGGYIFIGVGLILVILFIKEWRTKPTFTVVVTALLLMFGVQGCSSGPEPIRFGKDACHFCKMIITDQRFGAELITDKQKIYKFDDTHCVVSFLKSGDVSKTAIADIYLIDYSQQGQFVKATESFLFQSDALRSPMGGNVAAFTVEDSLLKFKQELNGTAVSWNELIQ
ncbi:nitrous oxide reductase accessory protein NosL [Lacibacter sp. H407]|uniref:nitrous oxide reductase accessory protein NosL n=1 Tax=Lacibacter sp. H407 TaxID=3133423 RepID=UPI0030C2AA36